MHIATTAKPPKKMLPLLILEILRERTDADHTLSQREIQDILESDYSLAVDRKAVRRNIDNLIEAGCPIECTEKSRTVPNPRTGEPEESTTMSDLWLEHDFTEAELRLLIDGVLFSNHIPNSQRKDLVAKLAGLSSKYFRAHVGHITTISASLPQSPSLFWTIEVLDDAISRNRKVRFHYLEYGTDKKLRPKRRGGAPREYVVSPYQMAAKDGKYYLICNYDGYDDVSNYRVDRIADIEILTDERARPFSELEGSGGGKLDLAQYMREHVYMYSSPNSRVTFRVVRAMVTDVVDEFGTDVEFSDGGGDFVTVRARVNERAMVQFAKNFSPDVLILKPERLAKQVLADAQATIEAYSALDES
ncbi:MAG: helix-turn-helix transcriptional regulator [Coriobacteriales bacterium]|jgi:predicted DNA-binding transcriptional regulator YafY